MKASAYYFILRCINSCKTLEQLECCERMINNIHWLWAADLANKALIRRCEMLVERYPVTE